MDSHQDIQCDCGKAADDDCIEPIEQIFQPFDCVLEKVEADAADTQAEEKCHGSGLRHQRHKTRKQECRDKPKSLLACDMSGKQGSENDGQIGIQKHAVSIFKQRADRIKGQKRKDD
ncbi:hypothetical protein SDC9_67415 [bioreactor metagenome]|uniref:Uncharacterized protein n=1 Tax=bioreactor metagenome TaxID=1076179 RepID=A0A644XXI9_9ZZZZ